MQEDSIYWKQNQQSILKQILNFEFPLISYLLEKEAVRPGQNMFWDG